jgi:hypothetical protein
MDYRSAYIRRNRKGSRLKKRVAAIALAGVAGCAILFALEMRESAPLAPVARAGDDTAALAPAMLRTAAQVETQEKKTRRVYPYSIVPGGLADRKELARAIVMDKVVAVHYAAFEADQATVETVRKPRAVYVSYRKGDKVYWTAKKLQLAEGETLLSDGRSEIRTRCGNRISDVPQLPVEARGPSEEELDSSVEVAADGAGEGSVQQVGFAVEGNPAGHGYQPQSFGTGGAAQNGGTSPTRTGAALTGVPSSGFGGIWDGGTLPVALASKVSSNTSGSGGSSTGTSGTGTPGTGISGTGTSDTGTSGTGTSSTGTSGTGTSGTGTSGTETAPAPTPATGGSKPVGTTTNTPKPASPATGGSNTPAPVTDRTPSDSGSPAGGTQPTLTPNEPVLPPIDPETKPTPLPDTLLPPTTDLPRQTNDPAKTPTKHGNVPEPGTLWLGGAGLAALLAARRAQKRVRH